MTAFCELVDRAIAFQATAAPAADASVAGLAFVASFMRNSACCERTVAASRARNGAAATHLLKSASPAWQEKRRSTKEIPLTASLILQVKEELEMLRKVAPPAVLTSATRLACVGCGSSCCEIRAGWTCATTATASRRSPRPGCACSVATGGAEALPSTAANTRRHHTRTRTLWPCRGTPRSYGASSVMVRWRPTRR